MFYRVFAFLLAVLAFCQSSSANPAKLKADLLGTWRWVSVDGRAVDQPFYVRYEADGTAASWPVPKQWLNSKKVSRGRYSVTRSDLVLETGSGKFDPKVKLVIKGDRMTMTNDDANQLVYRRVKPSLQPGTYEPRHP